MKNAFKKIISAILTIIILLQFSGCSNLTVNKKSESVFPYGLNNVSNEAYNFTSCTNVYLLKDKFIYTTLDESERNSFGDPKKLMICDLISGNVKSADTKPLSDISNMCYVNDRLYFTAYADTSTDWGFCLFSYDIENDELKTIYETPNTVQDIFLTVCSDTIFYCANADNQQNIRDDNCFDLHMYADDTDTVLAKNLSYDSLIWSDSNGAYFTADENKYIYVDCEGNKKLSAEKPPGDLKNGNLSADEDSEYIAIFGDYRIELCDEKPYIFDENDCGYKYSAYYYLYDTKNSKSYKLTKIKDWYYYA